MTIASATSTEKEATTRRAAPLTPGGRQLSSPGLTVYVEETRSEELAALDRERQEALERLGEVAQFD